MDGGNTALHFNIGAHADQFRGVHETVLENSFFKHAGSVCGTHQGHHLGLQVRGKTRKHFCDHVNGVGAAILARNFEALIRIADRDAGFFQLVQNRIQNQWISVFAFDPTTGHGSALLFYSRDMAQIPFASGMVLLTLTPGTPLVVIGPRPGPLASFAFPVPNDVAFCGRELSVQAMHVGGQSSVALSNAQDLRFGR